MQLYPMPAGVFQPYSGVKTSILLIDKTLAKKTDEILFVKVANDGFDLGAQRRPIEKNDLPPALKLVKAWKQAIAEGNGFELDEDGRAIAHAVSKKKIAESGDWNLSGDRYRQNEGLQNANFKIVGIGAICSSQYGLTATAEDYGDVRYLRITDITEDGKLKSEGKKFINPSDENKQKYLLANNDIVVACSGSIGRMFIYENQEPMVFASYLVRLLLDKNKVLPKYVFYQSKGDKYWEQVNILGSTVAQPNLNAEKIKAIRIPLPPMEIQKKIVAELDSYQKIIDGAKQVVENYKPTIKIDPDWPLVELGEVCSMEYGYTAKAQESGDTRFVRITDIDDNACLISDNPMFIDLSEESKPYLLDKGDVLIARTGATYGKTLLFSDNKQAVFASYLIRLSFNHDKVVPAFFTSFSLGEIYWQQARELVSGGGQPQFNANVIKRIRMPIPSLKTQQKLVAEIESERELVEANKKLIEIFEKKIKDKMGEVWGE